MNTPKESENQQSTPEHQEEKERKQQIAALNDHLRTTGEGGQVMATPGIASLPQETQMAISQAIQNFSDFTPENDPYGEHDLGSIEIQGITVFWKIDYYDHSMMYHSPNKADPNVTNRVMTIMLSSEY